MQNFRYRNTALVSIRYFAPFLSFSFILLFFVLYESFLCLPLLLGVWLWACSSTLAVCDLTIYFSFMRKYIHSIVLYCMDKPRKYVTNQSFYNI